MKKLSKANGKQILKVLAGLTAIFWLTACGKLVGVDVTVVDQKTALENQILGSYEELGNEMLLLASVRSVDETGKLKTVAEIPSGKKLALRAMQRQEFNRDDIQIWIEYLTDASYFLILIHVEAGSRRPGCGVQAGRAGSRAGG